MCQDLHVLWLSSNASLWCRSRKTLIYLILTLNHCYPDYDFSLLRAHHFRKEPGVGAVEEAVDSHLLEVSRVCPPPPQPLCSCRRLILGHPYSCA
jgi:hypothetical protein